MAITRRVSSPSEPGRVRRAALLGLLAAALFGASTPLSKLLLPSLAPASLAAILYLGSALAVTAARAARPRRGDARREADLGRSDLPVILGVIAAGGVVGPLLMLIGLGRISGVAASLLLNLETPLTMLLAIVVFREHLGRREALASLLIVVAAAAIGLGRGQLRADGLGVLAIAAACLSWAVDNNLTQRLSLRDPLQVTQVKSFGAGACNLGLAFALGQPPPLRILPAALALGAVSYGLSLVLNMRALRVLGAARQAAYFATAPFAGALLSVAILGDRLGPLELAAAALMGAGVFLLTRERHQHVHTHAPLEHDHLHTHDEHHDHAHDGPVDEPHAHPHRHEPLTHEHAHVSDVHHRHGHD